MTITQVFEDDYEIEDQLVKFGITKQELREVAFNAASARNEATGLHPVNAPGTFAYHEGVRSMRLMFLQKQDGWEVDRLDGIEVILHKEKNLVVVFQNVDLACGIDSPKAISEKRISSKKLIANATSPLFPEISGKAHENRSVWYLCVSSNADEVKMELSRPDAIDEKGQFSVFSDRIFIVTEDDILPTNTPRDDEAFEVDDFDIQVTKKG